MTLALQNLKKFGLYVTVAAAFTACKKDDDKPSIRTNVDYAAVNDATYSSDNGIFVDASGQSTVDVAEANAGYKMFQALNTYMSTSKTSAVTAATLSNMYNNTNGAFADASLNTSGIKLSALTASSWNATSADAVRSKFSTDFNDLAVASQSFAVTADIGIAGKLGTYIVDSKGIETQQIIQKGLIGAYQLDLISNVLLKKGLEANNSKLVSGKNYTELEHNWDLAFATLTPNANYLKGATNENRVTAEFGLGAYAWEYNRDNGDYNKLLPAFLKGRVAIINNDLTELNAQALIIRQILEKAIAKAAVGYLGKWRTNTTSAAQAHAIGEGFGFIYSLRFCTLNGGDAAFSDGILTPLIGSANGFWDLTPNKISTAEAAIKAKFNLQ